VSRYPAPPVHAERPTCDFGVVVCVPADFPDPNAGNCRVGRHADHRDLQRRPGGPLAGRVGVDGLGRFGWDVRPLTRCLSVVRLVGKRWPVEYRRRVLEELEPTIEDPAVNHLERNIGVPVEDPVPAGGAGDHREDHHPEAIYQASAEQRSAQSEAAEGA